MWTAHFTSHIFSWISRLMTHMRGSSRKFGVRSAHFHIIPMRHLHAPHVVCLILRDFSLLLFAVYLLSHHSVHLLSLQLHFPQCGGQIPCALQLMRTLAPLPGTTITQVMSPTTTTSQRPLNCTSRNPPARTGPWTRMTSSTMTTLSAWRSLHHCSPRSEKMMRAVDELIIRILLEPQWE